LNNAQDAGTVPTRREEVKISAAKPRLSRLVPRLAIETASQEAVPASAERPEKRSFSEAN